MTLPHRILTLVLTLQVTAAWALPTGVLCVAGDGHLALKSIESDCSHPGGHADEHGHGHGHENERGHPAVDDHSHARDHAHGATAIGSEAHGCHPCVDVELIDEPPAQSAGSDEIEPPSLFVIAHPTVGSLRPVGTSACRGIAPTPSPPPGLRALRTIVLTC